MRALASALTAFVLATRSLPAATLATQTPAEPTLVLTIFAGTLTGHALWHVDKQPLVVEGTEGSGGPLYDTLALRRQVSGSIAVGLQAVLYPQRHVGLELDISYLGLPYDNGCAGVYFNTDAENRNQQVCSNIDRSTLSGSAIAFYGGLNLRPWGGRAVNPFVRVGVGIATLTQSSVDVSGAYLRSDGAVRVRSVVIDDDPRRLSPSLLVGGGLTSALGPGYQLRLEARDVMVGLDQLDGPSNALGQASVSTRYRHRLVFTLGLDIVLEKKRGRRY